MHLLLAFKRPEVFYFLWLLLLPVLIHLIAIRKHKKVLFSDTSLLLKITGQGLAKRTLKKWFILMLRILAFVFLILAFAQPVDKLELQQDKTVFIYLDNSSRMLLKEGDADLFSISKLLGEKVVSSYTPASKFYLLTNNFGANDFNYFSQAGLLDRLTRVGLSRSGKSFREVLERERAITQLSRVNFDERYYISDFQTVNNEGFESGGIINLIPVRQEKVLNAWVDSVYMITSGGVMTGLDTLMVKIGSSGESVIPDYLVKVRFGGEVSSVSSDLHPGINQVKVPFRSNDSNFVFGTVELPEDKFVEDNLFHFSFFNDSEMNLLAVGDGEGFKQVYKGLFGEDSLVRTIFTSFSYFDQKQLDEIDVLVLESDSAMSSGVLALIRRAAERQKRVLVHLKVDAGMDAANSLLSEVSSLRCKGIDTARVELSFFGEGRFYQGVFIEKVDEHHKEDLPQLRKSFEFENVEFGEALAYKSNRLPYLLRDNNVFVFASSFDSSSSNLKKHPLVVPLIAPLLYGVKDVNAVFTRIDEGDIQVQEGVFNFNPSIVCKDSLVGEAKLVQGSGETLVVLPNSVQQGVKYHLITADSLYVPLFVNSSRLDQVKNIPDLNSLFSSADHILDKEELITGAERFGQGESYWEWCLITAILLLIAEMIALRVIYLDA